MSVDLLSVVGMGAVFAALVLRQFKVPAAYCNGLAVTGIAVVTAGDVVGHEVVSGVIDAGVLAWFSWVCLSGARRGSAGGSR